MSNEEREKKKTDPYIDGKRKKVLDFFLGILLMSVEASASFLPLFMSVGGNWDLRPIFWFIVIISGIADIIIINRFSKKKRRYIVFGMMVSMLPIIIGVVWFMLSFLI